jgi:hypothetical protein
MTKKMENNLTNNNNTQFFADTTYNAVTYCNKKFKLWVLIAFNKEIQHSILCWLALIKNENKETYLTIFVYLNNKYNFNPELIIIDLGRGCYAAIKEKYKNTNIILKNYIQIYYVI